jgi:hypothetical protein
MVSDGAKAYKEWHWGIEPALEVEWEDPDLPEVLVEAGRLAEIHYRPFGQNPKQKHQVLRLTEEDTGKSHLAFDPNHQHDRLYFLINPATSRKLARKLYRNSAWEPLPMAELAEMAGGRHATPDYPAVDVAPIGVMTNVVYATEKQGDGFSQYIHKMGEESGIQPALGIDRQGRIWICGGNYQSPVPGITD